VAPASAPLHNRVCCCSGRAPKDGLSDWRSRGDQAPGGRWGNRLTADPFDDVTIAGYVLSLIQRIRRQGELVETDGLRLTVLESDARHISRVRLQKR